MALTEADKKQIEDEEAYRQKVREEQGYRSQLQEKPKKKSRAGKLFLIFIGIVIVLSIMLSSSSSESINNTPQNTNNYQLSSKTGQIDVTRSALMNTLKNEGYSFRKDNPLSGEENYVAAKGKGEVQLLGKEENLSSASFTAYMGFDANGTVDSSVKAQTEMVVFSSAIDKTCTDWLVQRVKEAVASNEIVYEMSGEYCGRMLSLIYLSGDSMTFGVEPL
jgi:hypothetical protein